jgi:outer membrane protein assembly factor BamB
MYAIDMASGAREELFEADSWFWATPATDGRLLYAPNLDGILYAYDVQAGQVAWRYDQEGGKQTILADPVVVDGNVVLASDGGKVTLVSASGTRIADFAVAEDSIRAPLTTLGSAVYVHTLEELVMGFVVTQGSIEKDWEYRLEGF